MSKDNKVILRLVIGLIVLAVIVIIFAYQDYINIDLNGKQVMMMYWKERLLMFILLILTLIGIRDRE